MSITLTKTFLLVCLIALAFCVMHLIHTDGTRKQSQN